MKLIIYCLIYPQPVLIIATYNDDGTIDAMNAAWGDVGDDHHIECKFVSYEAEHCHCFGDIINTSVDESVLANGKIDVSKLKPITFDIDDGQYIGLGDVVAKAFSVGAAEYSQHSHLS